MGTRRQPTKDDESNARRIVLSGLAHGGEPSSIDRRLFELHPQHHEFPGSVLLNLAADAIALSGADRESPLDFADIRERFLPECSAHTKAQHYKSKWTIRAAAMINGGVDPGMNEELYFWSSDDFWRWSLDAVVVYVRAAAAYADVSVSELAAQLADKHGLVLETGDEWAAATAGHLY